MFLLIPFISTQKLFDFDLSITQAHIIFIMIGAPWKSLYVMNVAQVSIVVLRPANHAAGAWICQIYAAVLTLRVVVCAQTA